MSTIDTKLVLSKDSDVEESDLNIIKQLFSDPDSLRFLLLCDKVLINNNAEIPGSRYVNIVSKVYSCGLPEIILVVGKYINKQGI